MGGGDGRPQGETTGRYELVSNVGKPKGKREWKRWSDVPLWYRVLDRFGLPTLFVLILLWGGYRVTMRFSDILDRQATTFVQAMEAQVRATDKLADRIDHALVAIEKSAERRSERGP